MNSCGVRRRTWTYAPYPILTRWQLRSLNQCNLPYLVSLRRGYDYYWIVKVRLYETLQWYYLYWYI